MSIQVKLNEDMKAAMKSDDKHLLQTIRMIRAAVKNKEIDLRPKEMTEADVEAAVHSQYKQIKDQIEEYERVGAKPEVVEQLKADQAVILSYLPQQMDEAAITELVKKVITENGLSGKQALGKAMSLLKPYIQGKADGKLVKDIVEKFLQ